MKAITIWQPWASLIAIGAKRIETRSWPAKYRGPLAIHAAVRPWKQNPKDETDRSIGLTLWETGLYHEAKDLPYGAVIATCRLVDCMYITMKHHIEEPERSFGDYTIGRYAWILECIRQLEKPVPVKGRQGLWNWDPPEGIAIQKEV